MNLNEAKAQVVAGLQQATINMMVEKLAESIVEIEQLKEKLATLKKE